MSALSTPAPDAEVSPPPTGTRLGPTLIAFAIGTAVAFGLGVYGRLHTPAHHALNVAGFSSGFAAKSWLTTAAMLFALVQLFSAMVMWGRIKIDGGRWVGPLHRWSGRLAVLLAVVVASHCLYALGFELLNARTIVHSLFGCFFFGAFITKMVVLTRKDAPGWALPVLGGAVFSGLTALWMSAALWFFVTHGVIF